MKTSGVSQGQSASELISKRIAELADWRGDYLLQGRVSEGSGPSRVRLKALVRQAVALDSSGKSKPSKKGRVAHP